MVELIPITKTISIVPGKNQGRFPTSFSFVIKGDSTVLVDTGCGIDVLQELKHEFSIDYLINSHCHPDHSAGNWVFKDKPLWVPEQGFDTHGRLHPLSERLTEPGPVAGIWITFVTDTMGYQEMLPTDSYADGHEFDFGSCRLQAVHTPGHTADHFCFFEPENRILFSFDLDLTPFGPYYGHRESDLKELRESLEKMRQLNPSLVISSHREPVKENIIDQIDQFEEVLHKREEKIRSFVQQGLNFDQILEQKPIYGRYPYQPELMKYWEGQMISKHLKEIGV